MDRGEAPGWAILDPIYPKLLFKTGRIVRILFALKAVVWDGFQQPGWTHGGDAQAIVELRRRAGVVGK